MKVIVISVQGRGALSRLEDVIYFIIHFAAVCVSPAAKHIDTLHTTERHVVHAGRTMYSSCRPEILK